MSLHSSSLPQGITIEFIAEQVSLLECLEYCEKYPIVALDTEFVRTDTFYSLPGLVQLFAGNRLFLIDPQASLDMSPLALFLSSSKVKKVMHAMGEDVDLFHHWLKVTIKNVFDTQIAAGLLGIGASVGFASLCQTLLGVELDKSETRSDWVARPLSADQITYAANDVFYLSRLYPLLLKQIDTRKLSGIVEQETERTIDSICTPSDPEFYYLKLRGAWRLEVAQQTQLQQLAAWREKQAVGDNIPRSWVLPDKLMQLVVERQPETVSQLYSIPGMPPKLVKKYGADMLRVIRVVGPTSNEFQKIMPPLSSRQQELHKALKKGIRQDAEQASIPFELLSNNKVLEELVYQSCQHNRLFIPEFYEGWRWKFVGGTLKKKMESYISKAANAENKEAGE